MTTTEVNQAPIKDCYLCKITSTLGSFALGVYMANFAYKNKTLAGRVTFSVLSLASCTLGVARYTETYPFNKRKTAELQST